MVVPQSQDNKVAVDTTSIISTFILDDMEFGIDVKDIRETILFKGNILAVPTSLDIFEGIINLRENIIPILNLRKRFGLLENNNQKECYIAIIRYKNRYFGLKFDNISQVVRCDEKDFSSFKNENDEYCSNKSALLLENGKRLVQMLDFDILFKDCHLPSVENELYEDTKKFLEIKQDITFLLDEQEYSIGINGIREIINVSEIKNKVKSSSCIKGVISLRGELITIIDLKVHLFEKETETNKNSRVLLLNSSPTCGILVDSVKEIVNYEIDKLIPITDYDRNFLGNIFAGIISHSDNRDIIKIDINNLLDENLKQEIKSSLMLNKQEDISGQRTSSQISNEIKVTDKDYIIFKLNEIYGININEFQEIINYTSKITEVPRSKSYIKGMLNLRGELIFIFSLRGYYGLSDKSIETSKILILNANNFKIGVIVDDIVEILKTNREDVTIAPKLVSSNITSSMRNHIDNILMLRRKTKNGEDDSSIIVTLNAKKIIESLNLEKENIDGMNSFIIDKNELGNTEKTQVNIIHNNYSGAKINQKEKLGYPEKQDLEDFFPLQETTKTNEFINKLEPSKPKRKISKKHRFKRMTKRIIIKSFKLQRDLFKSDFNKAIKPIIENNSEDN